MANQNLQQIKLGAPSRIEGGAAPNAELSVQFMGLCEELTLNDGESKCTKECAIPLASRLIKRYTEDAECLANVDKWGIPRNNFFEALLEWADIRYSFFGTKKPYLYNNKTAYIATDYIPNTNTMLTAKMISVLEGGNAVLFGAREEINGPKSYFIWEQGISSKFRADWAYNAGQEFGECMIGQKYELRVKKGFFSVNGEILLNDDSISGGAITSNMYLFAGNYNGSVSVLSYAKLSNVLIQEGEETKHLFVPFFRDNEYGMLDMVTMKFFKNIGTGSFTYSLE